MLNFLSVNFFLMKCPLSDMLHQVKAWRWILAVVYLRPPKSPTEVRSLLGLATYYRRFVKCFSIIASSFSGLLYKELKFICDEKCQKSFRTLKSLLTQTPTPTLLIEGKEYVVYSDASHNCQGCILMQERKVIYYASQILKPNELNYETFDLEQLLWCLL